MAKVDLARDLDLRGISALLAEAMPQDSVETKGARVWVTRGLFQGCYVKPMDESTTVWVSGDMPGTGRIVMLGGLIALALVVYALTGMLVVGGVLVILGIVALRKLPSRTIQSEVQAALEAFNAGREC